MNKLIRGLFVLCAMPAKSQNRPNFVLIIADDVSQDDYGCYRNSQVKTPNIDRIAASGIRFTNFFLTSSSSSPSPNSIINGSYPHNTGGAELQTEPPDYMVFFPEINKRGEPVDKKYNAILDNNKGKF